MARKYAPTMYFVDYDDYMLAKMGIKLNDKSKEQAFDERKGLTRWLTDSFIFLVPVHYRVTPEEFLRTTDAALAIMKELEGSGRLIAGKNLTQAEKKELVTQYFQQIGEQHEFFKPTRTIKNIQYLRGIYCCFTSSGDVS